MRSNSVLLGTIEDMKLLYQYLYMSEEHTVTVSNSMTNLEISMDENGNFWSKNKSFPNTPKLAYNSRMSLETVGAIVSQLKEQSPTKEYFKNMWEEVKETAMSNTALNAHNCGQL